MQRLIVGVEEARSAHLRQCDDVGVVRAAGVFKLAGQPVDLVVVFRLDSPRTDTLYKPPSCGRVLRQFATSFPAHGKPSVTLVQPAEECPPRLRLVPAEHLMGHVRVENCAHLSEPERFRGLFEEETPVGVGRAEHVSLLVNPEGVDLHIEFAALEEEDGDVVWVEP